MIVEKTNEVDAKQNLQKEDKAMDNVIKNRSEILFMYDVTDSNPNGDPIDENKPRIDEETGINIVTDVRLKRTVRDYLHDFRQQKIFVRKETNANGERKTKENIFAEYKTPEEVINRCLDVRLFGGTFALKSDKKKNKKFENAESQDTQEENQEGAFSITGPVQFKFGRSLHKVDLAYVKGTTVMPSGKGKEQGTFTEKYILPYSLIAFYGIVNENAAQNQNIPLTEEDIKLLLEGIWNGTKNLISASKIGQMPRFLLRVVHKEKNFHIGELDKRVRFVFTKNDKELRANTDGKIDITELISTLVKNKDKIEKIYYKVDEHLSFVLSGKEITIVEALKEFKLEIFSF